MPPYLHIRKRNGSWFIDEETDRGINRYEGWRDGRPMSFNDARCVVAELLAIKAEATRRVYYHHLKPFSF